MRVTLVSRRYVRKDLIVRFDDTVLATDGSVRPQLS